MEPNYEKSKFQIIDFLRRELNYRPFRTLAKYRPDSYLYQIDVDHFQIVKVTTQEVPDVQKLTIRNSLINTLVAKLETRHKHVKIIFVNNH